MLFEKRNCTYFIKYSCHVNCIVPSYLQLTFLLFHCYFNNTTVSVIKKTFTIQGHSSRHQWRSASIWGARRVHHDHRVPRTERDGHCRESQWRWRSNLSQWTDTLYYWGWKRKGWASSLGFWHSALHSCRFTCSSPVMFHSVKHHWLYVIIIVVL